MVTLFCAIAESANSNNIVDRIDSLIDLMAKQDIIKMNCKVRLKL